MLDLKIIQSNVQALLARTKAKQSFFFKPSESIVINNNEPQESQVEEENSDFILIDSDKPKATSLTEKFQILDDYIVETVVSPTIKEGSQILTLIKQLPSDTASINLTDKQKECMEDIRQHLKNFLEAIKPEIAHNYEQVMLGIQLNALEEFIAQQNEYVSPSPSLWSYLKLG